MDIELKKLELTNYRNINYANFEFDNSSVIIGENRIGKTNILESIYWLLTDKLLDGSSDSSSLKPLNDTTLLVRVKATFLINGEKEITIEKQFGENWVKTRGTDNMSFQGHYTNYLFNGIKQPTVRSFKQLLFEDFGLDKIDNDSLTIDIIQTLINPFYLGNLGEDKNWSNLRQFIIKLVGNVSDDDVYNSDESLVKIKLDLEKANGRIDQLKKKYNADIDCCKKSIEGKKYQVELLENTKKPNDDEIEIARRVIEVHKDKIASLKVNNIDNASALILEKINSKESEVNKFRKEDLEKSNYSINQKRLSDEIISLRKEQSNLLIKKNELINIINNKQYNLSNLKNLAITYQSIREKLINDLKSIDSKIDNPEIITICPTCGRAFDDNYIKSSQSNEIERLKMKKSELMSEGLKNKELNLKNESDIVNLQTELDDLNNQLIEINNSLSNISNDIQSKEDEISQISIDDVEENVMILKIEDEIKLLREELKESKEKFFKGIQDNQQLIYNEQQLMIPYQNVLADYDHYIRNMDQLEKVKNELSDLSKKLIDFEQKMELLNKFNLKKLELIDKNVSKVFGNIKIQLIKENINGGYDNICKPYIYDDVLDKSTDISWKNGSVSERIATGIAMIEKIKDKLSLPNFPILFDEGGEISNSTFANRLKTNSQIICVKIVDDITNPLIKKLER